MRRRVQRRPMLSVPSSAHARRFLDDRALRVRRGEGPRRDSRAGGDHRFHSRPAWVRRRRRGAPLRPRRDRAARPVPARRHGCGGREDPRRDRLGAADLRPRRLRRRRDLRDHAGRSDPARARRRRRLAPAEPLRGGVRRLGRHDLAARRRGLRAPAHGRLRHHRGRGGRGREGTRARRDRHGPPPARRGAPRLPDRRHPALRLSVPGALRHGCRLQAGAGARRRRGAVPRPRRAGDDRRRRAAAGREPLAGDRRAARARADAAARPAGADAERPRRPGGRRRRRRRLPARAEDQRGRPARPARRRARAAADDRRGRGQASRRRAGDAEPRPAGGRGSDPARRRRRGRVVARAPPPSSRLRDLGRGLARGRDRDRRLAPGRALQPARRPDRGQRGQLEGLGPVAARLRSPRRARSLLPPPGALRRPPRRRRARDRPLEPGRVRGGVRDACGRAASPTRTSRP